MVKLYEISQELTTIENALDSEVNEETLEALAKEYFVTKEGFDGKIKSAGHLMLNQVSEESIVKAEIERLTNRLRTMKNKREWLKNYVKNHMEFNNILKLKFPEFTVTVVRNPASVEIDDITKISDKYIQTEIKKSPKKIDIKEGLQIGKKIDGARLITDKTNLWIK